MSKQIWIINALLPVSFSVEAETEEDAIDQAITSKRYSMTSPDGERLAIERDDIQSVQEADE